MDLQQHKKHLIIADHWFKDVGKYAQAILERNKN